ncbi:MAG: YaaA family protein [Campylobacterota bacterium]|nr:YaaA family protein [Campylobacterota bacterium]
MKILLAPAETKEIGGDFSPYCEDNFYFKEINNTRDDVVKNYDKFIQNSSLEELSKWFGLKNLKECEKYSKPILEQPTMKAIQRYTGVAFDALDYKNMDHKQQQYCNDNLLIFSNLFGVLKADDLIPDYKYKQGATLDSIDVIKEYKDNIKDMLDNHIGDEVIDLRAGYYDKFYKPTMPTITYKFLKDGKVVSHWAKHYRGLIVNELAKANITSFAELMSLEIQNLNIVEIQEKKNIKTLIMEIV